MTPEKPQAQPAETPGDFITRFEPLAPKNRITFEQVGGLDELKRQARLKIIEPFRHPELFKKFKKQAGGGLLLYGPPGCGKTWFARALAGECGAAFFNVAISDILDMWMGNSEKNLQALFATARAHKPAVIFIDEMDALGRKRELLRHSSGMSNMINQFLAEMDGIDTDNENLLVIGATNAPWDVDSAFRRPGRFDRTLLVPPPDLPARSGILQQRLQELPIAPLNYAELAEATAGFSGADLKGLVDRASETVLEAILENGKDENITQALLLQLTKSIQPSTLEWLDLARNVVEYANQGGQYQELADFLETQSSGKKRRMGFF
ncbi:ATP-binding protein [Marinospirillum perlucidum]|uniref:ATP-binding protein n=1 Tax=Marinospirillum perlucidum TaxID=1982602 RepID=UPI000DF3D3EE|nr:ATP-binding protein [Marinospirillum perlucidum]